MVLILLLIWTILVATTIAAYRAGNAPLCMIFFLVGAPCLLAAPVAFTIAFLPLAIATTICRLAQVSFRKYATGAAVVAAAPFVFWIVESIPHIQEIAELRREYPIESLRHRIPTAKVSVNQPQPAVASIQQAPLANDSPTMTRLDDLESDMRMTDDGTDYRGRKRTRSLMSLYAAHENILSEFISADGFGFSRTVRLPARRQFIDIPLTPVVPQPSENESLGPSPDAATPQPLAANDVETVPPPQQKSLDALHNGGVIDFANPGRFGHVVDVDHVIGFQPHAFSDLPQLPKKDPAKSRWQIAKLELVSLLKQPSPAVYESDNLPNMEQLDSIKTRPLDDFETDSLAKLRNGEDIVAVEASPNEIRMLGSVRAMEQCKKCHAEPRGELLGAFTYRIIRDPADTKPAAPPSEQRPY